MNRLFTGIAHYWTINLIRGSWAITEPPCWQYPKNLFLSFVFKFFRTKYAEHRAQYILHLTSNSAKPDFYKLKRTHDLLLDTNYCQRFGVIPSQKLLFFKKILVSYRYGKLDQMHHFTGTRTLHPSANPS
jgi:hypothetical protein